MDICEECQYYESTNGHGYCKIKHPNLSTTQPGTTAVWPVVKGDAKACGEFTEIVL